MTQLSLNPKRKSSSGFTIIELVVVVAIISILAAVLVPMLVNEVRRASVATSRDSMKSIGVGMQRFRIDTGSWPQGAGVWDGTTAAAAASFAAADTALFTKPASITACSAGGSPGNCWNGPYLILPTGGTNLAAAVDGKNLAFKVAYAATGVTLSVDTNSGAGFTTTEVPNLFLGTP